jgi:hypothetical protein
MTGELEAETKPAKPAWEPVSWRDQMALAADGAQIVAAIAVIVSLIFVGAQLQQTNAQLRRTENNATLEQFSNIRMMMIENRDVAELLARGWRLDEPLDAADMLRMEVYMSEFTWSSFHVWDRAQQGLLDSDEFTRGTAPNLARQLCTERGLLWWNRAKREFTSGFARDVDGILAALPEEACFDYQPPPEPTVANG